MSRRRQTDRESEFAPGRMWMLCNRCDREPEHCPCPTTNAEAHRRGDAVRARHMIAVRRAANAARWAAQKEAA